MYTNPILENLKKSTRRAAKSRKRIIQRLIGIALLILSAIFLRMTAGTGEDASAVILTVMAGFYFLFTKNTVIN